MTELLIQKETFSIANSLKDIFENRLHNVRFLSEGDENMQKYLLKWTLTYVQKNSVSKKVGTKK